MRLGSGSALALWAVLVCSGGCLGGGDGDGAAGGGSGGDLRSPRGATAATAGSPSPSGGNNRGGSVDTGLPSDAMLSDLSTGEALQACEAVTNAARRALSESEASRALCTVFAAVELQAADPDDKIELDECDAEVERCLAAGDSPTELITCDTSTFDVSGCDASVAEFEVCIAAAVAQAEAFAALFSCRTVADPGSLDPMWLNGLMNVEMLDECDAILSQCPDFSPIGGSSGNSGGGSTPGAVSCDDSCEFANDGSCDDGGPDSDFSLCDLGTDCEDCGAR